MVTLGNCSQSSVAAMSAVARLFVAVAAVPLAGAVQAMTIAVVGMLVVTSDRSTGMGVAFG